MSKVDQKEYALNRILHYLKQLERLTQRNGWRATTTPTHYLVTDKDGVMLASKEKGTQDDGN